VSTLAALRGAVGTDLAAIGPLLADDVQWYGPHAGGGCRSREDVLRMLEGLFEEGVRPRLQELRVTDPDGYYLMIAQTA
jgi:hypothetical protein